MELDELFSEVEPLIKKAKRPLHLEPYGRGKDFDRQALEADLAAGVKVCTKCRLKLPLDNFQVTKSNNNKIKGQCKACDSLAFKAWRDKNLDKVLAKDRATHYTRKYGLDPELSKILSNPDTRIQRCPICREVERLVLDHDHTTGTVRGLLCSACNSMLGYAKESIDTLYEAIGYLKRHKGV